MDLNQLNELDLSTIGDWPLPAKAAVIAVGCLLLGVAAYHFDIKNQLMLLETAERQEQQLRADFEKKQRKAANLAGYRQQLAEMEESFGAMLRQLPNKTEVASLLIDVSQTGLANGLEFERFEPEGENQRDFYAELPIRIRVNGSYHEFGRFISGLAALPRIVTIHDIEIEQPGGRDRDVAEAGRKLSLDATVKTYRYLDEGAAQ
ncbi:MULTISPECIES: type 4a pilus biogenesis protein PilO [Marichromatium]|uniref:Type IV pilus assembly protein PilO n=1 Tax=Marichromatium gracile TaxID=1048 RepID=A0A4R4AKX8_MARGR|nr:MULTISPECIES: type 4a pilus biogenesis protein PilO [Marichromatium]MBO8085205.1 type 4a pilus biogenesis protein PilO [Marichromatium sp.]MBK1707565.1 pilus assembly protein PilO [Marichromatium gracile]RNE91965.1 pilus assembly protein PilO [Marichromatium sp. AB31]RNE92918.1 pilus assembly protein PilO [Marichromatium sp. AB32]TCW39915.1 type IV pilus assembly protein PilO [Marichromatium gracile]